MGSLAAAWALTDPAHNGRFDVTIYQRDWLLGGKGASTRDNRHGLVLEHGVHLLLGFYKQALYLLRNVYTEARKVEPRVPRFDDVLLPWDHVWMAEHDGAGTWRPNPWLVNFPTNKRQPGASLDELPFHKLVGRAFKELLQTRTEMTGGKSTGSKLAALKKLIEAIIDKLDAGGEVPQASAVVKTVFEECWAAFQADTVSDKARHLLVWAYLLSVNLIGIIEDKVLTEGFDNLNKVDYRQWLRDHEPMPGIPRHLGSESPPVLALYDLAFSRKSNLAAGVTLRALFRMLGDYAGHFTYKMIGGMGEIVFSPLYIALDARPNVTFKFMHEVTELRCANGAVTEIDVLAPDGALEYATPVKLVDCADGDQLFAWPAEPPALAEAPHYIKTLKKGTDFDVAVLGIAVGGLTDAMVGPLKAASPAFRDAIDHATVIPTQAAQLWMTCSGEALGWPAGPPGMLISYARRSNAWVDMSHVVPKEGKPDGGGNTVSVHYLCDELYAGEGTIDADIKANVKEWLNKHAAHIWPQFTWDKLWDPNNGQGEARLDAQYFRANLLGSEQYVTAGPRSVHFRLAPDESGFHNLALAGDWVRTEINSGCLEGATDGGLNAAQAIIDGRVKP